MELFIPTFLSTGQNTLYISNFLVLTQKSKYQSMGQNVHQVLNIYGIMSLLLKVQVGKDQEKAQSEKDSHSKNRGGKN